MVDATGLIALALVAFAGGALGAALGATRAFSVAGLLIVVGEIGTVVRGGAPDAAEPGLLGATGIAGSLGLGPAFGPHVAFAGGLAAAAYAARRGYPDTEFDYHPAKHVTRSLGARADVLAVGGVFGIIGAGLARSSAAAGLPWDPIAASIVASGLLHRIAFGYPLVGSVHNGLLNMHPYERGIRRPRRAGATDGAGAATPDGADADEDGPTPEEAATAGTRYAVEPWLPHQYRWADVALLGAVAGVFSGFVTYRTGSPLLAFGIAAASLAFLAGHDRVPVTYHTALPGGIAVVGLAGAADPSLLDATAYVPPAALREAVSLPIALAAAGALGLLAGLFGELAQRALYAHADTHLDPGAAGIVLATLLVALLDVAGVLSQNVVPAF